MEELIREVTQIIQNELNRANEMHPLFIDAHQGQNVIREELEEAEYEMEGAKQALKALWEEVKHNESADILTLTAKDIETKAMLVACEAIQTSAMCRKFIDSLAPLPRTLEDEGQALKEK